MHTLSTLLWRSLEGWVVPSSVCGAKSFSTYMSIYLPSHKYFASKVSITTALTVAVLATTTLYAYFQLASSFAFATSTVQTSVTVLNTPPQWTVNAHEIPVSATTTPTNAGTTLTFRATATDSSTNDYFLLICSTSGAPTANPLAPPTCPGGSIMWARSATTTSGNQATAATTTIETFPFNQENNNWFAWVCDAVSANPGCVSTYTNGDATASESAYPENASPFVINHPPIFFSISNDTPANPGESITWSAVATDTDLVRGGDTIKLLVCRARDYANGACGAGGTWASSTLVNFNPATTTQLVATYQDRQYNAYAYVVDQNNLAATTTYLQGGFQGYDSSFVVNNVAPTIQGSELSFYSSSTPGQIQLYRPNATSGVYWVDFTVNDANGCVNASSTPEIVLATTTVFRSSVANGGNCTESTNNCYPSTGAMTYITCTADTSGTFGINSCTGSGASGGSPSGTSDSSVGYRCTVNLWFNADPTDAGPYSGDTWLADAEVRDDGQGSQGSGLYSAATTSLTGVELLQFLAYNVSTTSIAYGGLQPGQNTGAFHEYTDLIAWGNTGLDQRLYGDVMCTTWSGAESCAFASSTAIAPWNQQMATTTLTYLESGGVSNPNWTTVFGLGASTSPTYVALGVNKPTSTSTPFAKNTYWGIGVPNDITFSGNYFGQNTIIGVVSNASYW